MGARESRKSLLANSEILELGGFLRYHSGRRAEASLSWVVVLLNSCNLCIFPLLNCKFKEQLCIHWKRGQACLPYFCEASSIYRIRNQASRPIAQSRNAKNFLKAETQLCSLFASAFSRLRAEFLRETSRHYCFRMWPQRKNQLIKELNLKS